MNARDLIVYISSQSADDFDEKLAAIIDEQMKKNQSFRRKILALWHTKFNENDSPKGEFVPGVRHGSLRCAGAGCRLGL